MFGMLLANTIIDGTSSRYAYKGIAADSCLKNLRSNELGFAGKNWDTRLKESGV